MRNKKRILEKTGLLIYVGCGHDSFITGTGVASIPPPGGEKYFYQPCRSERKEFKHSRMIALIENLKLLANIQWQLALPFAVE